MESTIKIMGDINKERTEELISSGEVIQTENPYLVTDVVIEDIHEPLPTRALLNGETSIELDESHELRVSTKCPGKWILQDLETGQVYRGTNSTEERNQWKEIIQNTPQK